MFYVESQSDGEFLCVFNPPVRNSEGNSTFIVVKSHWWCGRFKPKDNLTAIEWVAWQKGLEEDATRS